MSALTGKKSRAAGTGKAKGSKAVVAVINGDLPETAPSSESDINTTKSRDLVLIDSSLRIKDESPVGGKKVLELVCRTETEEGDEIEHYTSRFEENNQLGDDGLLVSERVFEESASKSSLATQDDGSEVIASSELRHKEDEKVTKSNTGKVFAEYSICSEEVHEQTTCSYETVGDQVKKTARTKRRGSVSSSTRRQGDEMAALEGPAGAGNKKEKFVVSFNSDTSDSEEEADVTVSATLTLPNGNVSSDTEAGGTPVSKEEAAALEKKERKKEKKKAKKEAAEEIEIKASDSELKKDKKSKKKEKEKEITAVSGSEKSEEQELVKEKKKKKKDKDKDKESEKDITDKMVSETLDVPKKEKKHKKRDKEKYSESEQETIETTVVKTKKSKRNESRSNDEQEKQSNEAELVKSKKTKGSTTEKEKSETTESTNEKVEKKSKNKDKKSQGRTTVSDLEVTENICTTEAKKDNSGDESNASSFNFASAFSQSVQSGSVTKAHAFEAGSSQGTDISSVQVIDSGISTATAGGEGAKSLKKGKQAKMDALIVHTESIDMVDGSEDDDESVSTEASTDDEETITFENTSDQPITINVEYDEDGNIFVSQQDAERLGMGVDEVISALGLQNECQKISNEMSKSQTTTTTKMSSASESSDLLTAEGGTVTGRRQVEHTVSPATSPKPKRRSQATTASEDNEKTRQTTLETRQSGKEASDKKRSPRSGSPCDVTKADSAPLPSASTKDRAATSKTNHHEERVNNRSEVSNNESHESSSRQQVSKTGEYSAKEQCSDVQREEKNLAHSEQTESHQFISHSADSSRLGQHEEQAGTGSYIKQAISSNSESTTRVVSQESSDERFDSRQESLSRSGVTSGENRSERQQGSVTSSSEGYNTRGESARARQEGRDGYQETTRASRSEIGSAQYAELSPAGRNQPVTGDFDDSNSARRQLPTQGNSVDRLGVDGRRVRVETGSSANRQYQNSSSARETRQSKQHKMAEENTSEMTTEHVECNGVESEHLEENARSVKQNTASSYAKDNTSAAQRYNDGDANERLEQNGFHEKTFETGPARMSDGPPSSPGRGRLIGQVCVTTGEPGPAEDQPRTRAEEFELDSSYAFDRTSTDDLIKRILAEAEDEDGTGAARRYHANMGDKETRNQTSRYRQEEETQEESYTQRTQNRRMANNYDDEDAAGPAQRPRRAPRYDDHEEDNMPVPRSPRRRMRVDQDELEGEAYLDKVQEMRERQKQSMYHDDEEDMYMDHPPPMRRQNRYEDEEDGPVGRGGGRYQDYHDDQDHQEPSLLERRLASMGLSRRGNGRGGYQQQSRYEEMEGQRYEESRQNTGRSMVVYNNGEDEGRRRWRSKQDPYSDERLSKALRPMSFKNPYLDQDSDEDDRPIRRNQRKAVQPYISEQEFVPQPRAETREVVAEKTLDIRGVVERQIAVVNKLKYAAHSFDELDAEIRDIKEAFIESVVRKHHLLDAIDACAADIPHFDDIDDMEPKTKYGRALALRRSLSAIEYPTNHVSPRDMALDKLSKDIASEPTKIGKGALHSLARKEGYTFNKTTGEYDEVCFEEDESPKRRKCDGFEDDYEEDYEYKSSYFNDEDDDDSMVFPSYRSRKPILAIDNKPYHSSFASHSSSLGTHGSSLGGTSSSFGGLGSYRNKYPRRASISGSSSLDVPGYGAYDSDDDSLSTHSAEGLNYGGNRPIRPYTAAGGSPSSSFKSRFLKSSYGSSATDSSETKSSSITGRTSYADIKAKYGLSSSTASSTDTTDRLSQFSRFGRASSVDVSNPSRNFDKSDSIDTSSRFLNKVRQKKASGESITRDKPFKSRFLNKTIEPSKDASTTETKTGTGTTD